jgi:hypothetical protein
MEIDDALVNELAAGTSLISEVARELLDARRQRDALRTACEPVIERINDRLETGNGCLICKRTGYYGEDGYRHADYCTVEQLRAALASTARTCGAGTGEALRSDAAQ